MARVRLSFLPGARGHSIRTGSDCPGRRTSPAAGRPFPSL